MFDSAVFDVVVGLVFLLATFSVIVSSLTEAVSRWLGLRGQQLLIGIRALVDGDASGMTTMSSTFRLFQSPFMGSIGQKSRTVDESSGFQAESPPPSASAAASLFDSEQSMNAVLLTSEERKEAMNDADSDLAAAVSGIGKKEKRDLLKGLPSYIASRQFASAVLGEVLPTRDHLEISLFKTYADREVEKQPAGDQPGLLAALVALEMSFTEEDRKFASLTDIKDRIHEQDPEGRDTLVEIADAVAEEAATEFAQLKASIRVNFSDSTLGNALVGIVDEVGDDVEEIRARLERTFDDHMDRVSGWYKRHTRKFQLLFAALVVVVFNVNLLRIADNLYSSDASRATVVALAENVACSGDESAALTPEELEACVQPTVDALAASELPVFWPADGCGDDGCDEFGERIRAGIWDDDSPWHVNLAVIVFGYGLAWFGLVPGSRFWFDALAKLNSLRSGGKPPEKSQQPG